MNIFPLKEYTNIEERGEDVVMINSLYISQLQKCNELNQQRKKYLASLRLIKVLLVERKLKKEVCKLQILEEIRDEINKYRFAISKQQKATIRRFNHAYDKKSG